MRHAITGRGTSAVLMTALLIAALGCSKSEGSSAEAGDGQREKGASATGGDPGGAEKESSERGGEVLFDYPPAGDGPHQGYDLEAIRAKLQGTWMVGGAAFGKVPTIWDVRGDELTVIDPEGQRSEHTIQLLAPCYAKIADKGKSSATYVHYVFDGDTLYQGLGNAGRVDGDKTIGCMSAAAYVLEGDSCTRWVKKSFPRKGEPMWDKEPGDCGYEEGTVFYGDDTKSKRKIYGKQKLPVKVGSALMTRQMQGNRARRMGSLDEAVVEQKEARDQQAAASAIPSEFPFSGWKLPERDVKAEANQRVWAAAVNRDGSWRLAGYRMDEIEEGVVRLRGMSDRFAPPAFVVVPSETPKAGDAVAYIAGRELYGYVAAVDGDALTMRYLSGRRIAEKTAKVDRFLRFPEREVSLGAPVLYRDGDDLRDGRAVAAVGDEVYVMHRGEGREQTVTAMKKTDVTLNDGSVRHDRGARVWVKQSSGVSPLRWLPGTVVKVHADGAAYDVETEGDRKVTQSWAYVARRP